MLVSRGLFRKLPRLSSHRRGRAAAVPQKRLLPRYVIPTVVWPRKTSTVSLHWLVFIGRPFNWHLSQTSVNLTIIETGYWGQSRPHFAQMQQKLNIHAGGKLSPKHGQYLTVDVLLQEDIWKPSNRSPSKAQEGLWFEANPSLSKPHLHLGYDSKKGVDRISYLLLNLQIFSLILPIDWVAFRTNRAKTSNSRLSERLLAPDEVVWPKLN